MQDKDAFSDLKRAKEEEYFRNRERELIEKLKQRSQGEESRQQLAAATGIADEDVLKDLHDLGYTRETVPLLHLVPLIYVGWAEGDMSKSERELILDAARLRGVTEGTTAHNELIKWLERRPSFEFFEKTLRVIAHLIGALNPDEQQAARQDLLTYSQRVAEASGGILGLGRKISEEERAVLEEISRTFESGRKKAVQEAIKDRTS